LVISDRIRRIEEEQNRRQNPELVMDLLDIKPDMRVGELGAGRGRYVIHVARRLGEKGVLYANDIDERMLKTLRARIREEGLTNVVPVKGTETDPRLPGSLDLVYIINAYHDFTKPVELLQKLCPSLDGGGALAIIEVDPDRSYSTHFNKNEKDVINELARAGYTHNKTIKLSETYNIYFFTITVQT